MERSRIAYILKIYYAKSRYYERATPDGPKSFIFMVNVATDFHEFSQKIHFIVDWLVVKINKFRLIHPVNYKSDLGLL
tara:strand:- start:293 stop:526 length:234 start_codon:yes stop_codon:yes gene_type:complete